MNERRTTLERKMRSYRSARTGSIFLAVVSVNMLVLLVATGEMADDLAAPTYASAFFWPALAYICHLHIKLMRAELLQLPDEGQSPTDGS